MAKRRKGINEGATTGVPVLQEMAALGELVFPVINVSDSVTKSQVRQRARLPLLALRRATSCGTRNILGGGPRCFLALRCFFRFQPSQPLPGPLAHLPSQNLVQNRQYRDPVTCLPAHTEQGFAKVADVRKIFPRVAVS